MSVPPEAVHQVVSSLLDGDTVGSHVLGLQRGLRERGLRSEVYAEVTSDAMASLARPAGELLGAAPQARTVLLYHFTRGCRLADQMAARSEPLVLVSHDITPPHLFIAWAADMVWELVWAQRQLVQLAARVDLALADSEFNATDLRRAGYRRVAVAPLVLEPARWSRAADLAAPRTVTMEGRLSATALARVICDERLRQRLVRAGQQRVADLDPAAPVDAVMAALETVGGRTLRSTLGRAS